MPVLVQRSLISSSGTPHVYYGVTEQTLPTDEMFTQISSYPPLGQDTVFPADQKSVDICAFVQSKSDQLEVELWHNASKDWSALPLAVSAHSGTHRTTSTSSAHEERWFSAALTVSSPPEPISFTLRCRQKGEAQWKWANDSGNEDGQLLFQTGFQRRPFSHYFPDHDSKIAVEDVHSETADTQVFQLMSPVAAAHDDESGTTDVFLGEPAPYTRWFAHVTLWSPWIGPRHGRSSQNKLADKDGLLYSFLLRDGTHLVVLAISGLHSVNTSLRDAPSAPGSVLIHSRNDNPEPNTSYLITAAGKTFDSANAAAIYQARRLVTQQSQLSPDMMSALEAAPQRAPDDVKANWVQNWWDGFTYCTWNGLGQELSESKILNALSTLKSAGVSITNLIVDDNWQSLDPKAETQFARGWTDFEANKAGFPNGLSGLTKKVRGEHPSVQHIAVWHALLGYWGGVSPHGSIAKQYKLRQVQQELKQGPLPTSLHVVDESDVKRMYDDFYQFLSRSGIDSVKTDAQFIVTELHSAPSRRALITAVQDAWSITELRYFGSAAISCMSMAPAIIFHSQLSNNFPPLVLRNSDDFFPDVEDSHPWHIFTNAHTALLSKHLNVLPDWDMFQTDHKWSGFHAAARAVSGGPIYITDEPGRHNMDLIRQMTAKTVRRQTVILRPSVVGRSASVYVGYEESKLCKVVAYDGNSGAGRCFMGIFNVREHPITEITPFTDFLGAEKGIEYLLRSHRTGASSLIEVGGLEVITVKGYDWDILAATPVVDVAGVKVSNLGLNGKMTGSAAILSSQIDSVQDGRVKVGTTLKALGPWGIWIGGEQIDLKRDLMALIGNKPVPVEAVRIEAIERGTAKGTLVEVDLEKAWEELKLQPGWSNEVDAVLFISVKGA